uniref:NADH-ubiquinone oxidoreductase chain 2 n=1 Tax=Ammothea carolinensis TaxID=648471 RepID=E3SHE4_AMMCA|nr:NADH dehydrogenase subunit 2 [Ammothea carolinensis]ACY00249.1 NADH dehydrogenase subunit 2 [Ammothea carolinensis]
MNKFLLMTLILLTLSWGLSSSSWFSLWMALEINNMMIMPLMLLKTYQQYSESTIKYFLIQSISSLTFIMSSLMINNPLWMFMNLNLIFNMIMLSMMMKIGMFPFMMWYIEIITKTSFLTMKLIMTIQKIMPMIIINMTIKNYNMLFLMIMINMMFSSLTTLNQTNMKKILSLSSINHMGWMLMSLIFNYSIFIIYFIIYSLILFMIISFMKIFSIKYIMQMLIMNNIYFTLNIMSMAGLPPFSGFMMKWMIINLMMNFSMIFLSMIMILSSMISLYFYLRLIMLSFMMSFIKLKWNVKINYKLTKNYLNMMSLLNLMSIPFLNFIMILL